MVPLVSRLVGLVGLLGHAGPSVLGACVVCGAPVRECDDRMRLHGRFVHTSCAGYRLRQIARPRTLGSRDANRAFTGD